MIGGVTFGGNTVAAPQPRASGHAPRVPTSAPVPAPGPTPLAPAPAPPSALASPTRSHGASGAPTRTGDARPSPTVTTELEQALRELHPRPGVRSVATGAKPATAPIHTTPSPPERSPLARNAIYAAMGLGVAQNAIDAARLVKKLPEAHRADRLGMALRQLAVIAPDARIIDPSIRRGAVVAGRTFTRVDEWMMKGSVGLGTSLAAVQVASAVPNLVDALGQEGGAGNLAQTKSGRAGSMQLAGGTLGLVLFGRALQQSGDSGERGIARLVAAGKAPVMARPLWKQVGIASAMVTVANELGYFDMLDRGATRPTGEVLQAAIARTPILGDSDTRGGVLGVASGLFAVKGTRAALAAGSLAGLGKGPAIGTAIAGSLLGAHLLGALD